MDNFSALESFVAAVDSGSLSGAARNKNISQSAVSQQIASLEAKYGALLLSRTRNGVQMTQAGEVFYKHAKRILSEHAQLVENLANLTDKVTGRLVITANLGYSQHILSAVIVDLAKLYPDLEIILRPDAKVLDLVEENIDIALRSGSVEAGGGYVQKIATMSMVHVATPTYLDQAGRPQTPDDLIKLDHIQFKTGKDQIATNLGSGAQSIQVPIKTGFTAQFPDLMIKALEGGMGYAKMPEFFVAQDVKDGKLEIILPDWNPTPTDLFLVFKTKDRSARKYNAFLKVFFDHLGRRSGVNLVKF
ncbi:MAG: LysR family transcriptional regulator [Planktomarina sp.]